MRYAARIEYDGSQFSGWQTQLGEIRTIQLEVEKALSKVANSPVSIVTAGRTDAKVHATHQVIHFDCDADRSEFAWCRGANRFLDKDVRLIWVKKVDPEFHARFSALSRSYRFIIHNSSIQTAILRRHVSEEFRPLNPELMSAAGELLLGEHDFSSFRAAGCQAHSPIRNVTDFSLDFQDEWIWFDITANAFLQHMVRNIAGSLIEVGCGKRDLVWMERVLANRDRTTAGITAPANGLYLIGVEYADKYDLPSKASPISFWQ